MRRSSGVSEGAPSRAGWKWWHGMAAGMLLMLSPGTALIVAVLAAPCLFMLVADTSPGRAVTRTVLLFSLAGAIEPFRALVTGGHDMQAAMQILTRPGTVPLVWLLAACGWLINEGCCLSAAFITERRLAARRRALELLLRETCAEWQLPEQPVQPS